MFLQLNTCCRMKACRILVSMKIQFHTYTQTGEEKMTRLITSSMPHLIFHPSNQARSMPHHKLMMLSFWIASSVTPDVGTSHRRKVARTADGAFPEVRVLMFNRKSTRRRKERARLGRGVCLAGTLFVCGCRHPIL